MTNIPAKGTKTAIQKAKRKQRPARPVMALPSGIIHNTCTVQMTPY